MDSNEDIAAFTQQCCLRLYIITQMCSAVEIKAKEKHQYHGEVIEEPLSPFVQKHMHVYDLVSFLIKITTVIQSVFSSDSFFHQLEFE